MVAMPVSSADAGNIQNTTNIADISAEKPNKLRHSPAVRLDIFEQFMIQPFANLNQLRSFLCTNHITNVHAVISCLRLMNNSYGGSATV